MAEGNTLGELEGQADSLRGQIQELDRMKAEKVGRLAALNLTIAELKFIAAVHAERSKA